MADNAPITLNEGNDETVLLTITATADPGGDDLTAVTSLEFYLKADECDSDAEAELLLTSANILELEILTQTATEMTAEAHIPAAALAGPYPRFYKVDALSGTGQRRTALYGRVTVNNL